MLLSVIPILLVILFVYYKIAVGEYSLGGYFDPAYAYLFNSLNLAQFSGLGAGHIDHPGTTVQAAGAVIMKIAYGLSDSNEGIVIDALKRPEFYVSCMVYTFIIFTGICDFLLGLFSFRRFKKLSVAFAFQITPFFSAAIYDHIADLSAESLLIPSVLLMLALAVSFTGVSNDDMKKTRKYLLMFSLLSSFGLITKLTFFPLMIIPFLLLSGVRNKILFFLSTFAFSIVFAIPALSVSNVEKFTGWIKAIILHSGQHGTGPQYIIHGSSFAGNLNKIFTSELQFLIAFLILAVLFYLQFFPKVKAGLAQSKLRNLMNGIFISMIIYVIIVAKHFDYKYLIPAYMLCIPGLVISFFVYRELIPAFFQKFITAAAYPAVVILIIFQMLHLDFEFKYYSESRHSRKLIEDYRIKNYPNLICICGTEGSKEYALYFGAGLSGEGTKVYFPKLRELYPDYICFEEEAQKFGKNNFADLKSLINKEDSVVFQTDDKNLLPSLEESMRSVINESKIVSKEVFRNGRGEMLYLITPAPK